MIKTIISLVLITFLLGLSLNVYEGNELTYEGIVVNGSNSTLNQGVIKLVDGTMTITYEIANIVGDGMKEKEIDFKQIVSYFSKFVYALILAYILWFIGKLVVYVYIFIQEIKFTKREKARLQKLKERRNEKI